LEQYNKIALAASLGKGVYGIRNCGKFREFKFRGIKIKIGIIFGEENLT